MQPRNMAGHVDGAQRAVVGGSGKLFGQPGAERPVTEHHETMAQRRNAAQARLAG